MSKNLINSLRSWNARNGRSSASKEITVLDHLNTHTLSIFKAATYFFDLQRKVQNKVMNISNSTYFLKTIQKSQLTHL